MKKKISVLMTVYNTEKYLKQSINSILNQSYKNFELVIVDDCSSDGSRKLIKDLKNKRVKKYFLKRHTGRTPALNFGLSKCKGKYIAVMDADDIAHKNRLLKQKKFLEKDDNRQIVGSNIVFINEYGNALSVVL